jgi:4-hydroxy-3-polyprenylbenzoate decarboxylase
MKAEAYPPEPFQPAYSDLREWLQRVEQIGELKTVCGADWNLEMAGLAEIVSREAKGTAPALLFDRIKDYPPGYRALFLQLDSVGRLALTLGLSLQTGDKVGCVRACREQLRALKLQPARFVDRGRVQQNVKRGDEIDLLKFPFPKHHELDGGRYVGTAHCVITQDPDSGWVNLGTYRCMLFGKNSVGLHMSPGRHGRTMRDKCFERSQPFKVAVALGPDPALFLASTMAVPAGVSEYEFAGALRGEAIDVVEGPYTKLPIPAHAEIVIEGECIPGETQAEGPFGEWAGYYANCGLTPVPEPVVRVKTLLHRDNPIVTCAQPARPPGYNFAFCVFRSAMIWDEIEKAGVPDVCGVWCHEAGGSRLFNVVSVKQRYPGHARQAGIIASQCASGVYIGRYTVVVDDDIDVGNLSDVIWAIATRADPEVAIEVIRRCRSSSADPAISPDKKGSGSNPAAVFTSKAVIDACWPYEWKQRAYPVVQVSPELRRCLLSKWAAEFEGVL